MILCVVSYGTLFATPLLHLQSTRIFKLFVQGFVKNKDPEVGLGYFIIYLLVIFCGQDFVGPSKLRCRLLINNDQNFCFLFLPNFWFAAESFNFLFKAGLSDGGETHPEHGCHRPQHDQVAGKLSGRDSDIFTEG